ncbi:hypothetical protein K435DRAFT_877475 [Dendrothele bispora CBS 962.96]|uniref:Uncharacterized protein n=1 Tax=Dendrothele bispora (strain CBS 962.96) TaxID=1314807 RepID=A0A4S8KQ27_DENBC|nr:hypothetical protein K435DRAFT_877475 [Dendrothele bispora CBS 962.96]
MHNGVYFQYFSPSIRDVVGSMKLESYVRLKSGTIAIPVLSFTNDNFPKLIVAFFTSTPLNGKNTIELIRTVKDALQIDDNFFNLLELGGVVHEPGIIPLKGSDPKHRFFIYKNLILRVREGVYVCNLPNFPMVTNPTLTLVTLTLRLSKTILPRTVPVSDEEDVVYVIDQTGDRIKVFISNHAGVKMR